MGRLSIALALLIFCMFSASMKFGYTCHEVERKALFKFQSGFADVDLFNSWVGDDCCSWKGVVCDNSTGNVIKLGMRGNNENSSFFLPSIDENSSLLELKYLTYLDLSGFNFYGLSFPRFIGSMRQLRYLNLSNTNFGGKVPRQLGNLTKLIILDLNHACVDCKMESNNLGWTSKFENLQYLGLNGMNLKHTLDSLNILFKLPSLRFFSLVHCRLRNSHLVIRNSTISSSSVEYLNLNSNQFSGPIPHFIQNLSSIRFLDLSFNHFNSSLPSWLGNKLHLRYLNLGHNHFNGPFLHLIQNLSSLTNLDLSNNQFCSSIVDGGIMNTINNLCSLTHLDLSHNQLQQEVSQSSLNFSRCGRHALESMYIQNNNLSGYLPTSEIMLSLRVLDLSYNRFEIIPPSLWELSSLESVILSNNLLLGVISQKNLGNLSFLTTLDISSNPLTLDISSKWQPPFQLEHLLIQHCMWNTPFPKWILTQERILNLDLSYTGIFGPLPQYIGNALPYLQTLHLSNNHMNGSIPRSLCVLTRLWILDLQNNGFSGFIPDCWVDSEIFGMELSSNLLSGTIPNSLVQEEYLELLSLNNNSLTGMLPSSVGVSLKVFDVGENNLYGEIPPWNASSFTNLQILILRRNNLKGIIPVELCSIIRIQIIDLASNNLGGNIPECFGHFEFMGYNHDPHILPSMGIGPEDWSAVQIIKGETLEYTTNLHLLVNMDLSCNNLVGVIPTSFTNLFLLLGLNLSFNHINGTIPQELGNMRSLESLDLSHNNLSGSIPQSISSIYSLSKMNLSFNHLQGQIPTGNQLQTLEDSSIYMGNPGLCGNPLPSCFNVTVVPPSTSTIIEDEEENKHEKMWFYLVILLGLAIGFWGVIGTLVVNRTWRQTYFQLAEELGEWIYVKVALMIAHAKTRN